MRPDRAGWGEGMILQSLLDIFCKVYYTKNAK